MSALTTQQQRSLRRLQQNVEIAHQLSTGVQVTPAQWAAMQAAFDEARAQGKLPPEAVATAQRIGLKV